MYYLLSSVAVPHTLLAADRVVFYWSRRLRACAGPGQVGTCFLSHSRSVAMLRLSDACSPPLISCCVVWSCHDLHVGTFRCYRCDIGCSIEVLWFCDYLTHRLQRVITYEEITDWIMVSRGFPQGSGLSPLLFSIFVRNLPRLCSSPIFQFADG